MLSTIAIILIILWVIGVATGFVVGGLIHILLVIAVIVLLFRLVRGQGGQDGAWT